ncbi:hypothetical protein CEXT_635761 [Caerostris extrusa]|uniref:Uncharacterized protein n=1 Tax=Caerostris extrusa TaxID=172846 RepID=A0AAV4RNS9_CAEEX|nr:hypothetical protein CEXT_635761 [Caerostris extrusa]
MRLGAMWGWFYSAVFRSPKVACPDSVEDEASESISSVKASLPGFDLTHYLSKRGLGCQTLLMTPIPTNWKQMRVLEGVS